MKEAYPIEFDPNDNLQDRLPDICSGAFIVGTRSIPVRITRRRGLFYATCADADHEATLIEALEAGHRPELSIAYSGGGAG